MRVHVVGDGVLAETTRTCCQEHFELVAETPDVVWVCVENEDVFEAVAANLPTPDAIVVISTPVLVGTCAELERRHPTHTFVVSPENLRYATAEEDFRNQTRVVVGGKPDARLKELFAPFCQHILWMAPESAEMVKHALNTWLAVNVAFGNELGRLCEQYFADADDVVAALHAERRVGRHAPIRPGPPPSDHLMREVNNMVRLGAGPLIRSLL